MESGNNKYNNTGNNNLHIHSGRRTMCNSNYFKRYYRSAGNANIHCHWPAVSKRCCASTSNNVNKRHNRYMEPCNHQHSYCRNNHLYLYAGSRPVRYHCTANSCYQSAGYTNVYRNWSAVSKQYSAGSANNINERHYRYMEPRNHQHSYCRNNYVYIHAGCRSMRNKRNVEHYH